MQGFEELGVQTFVTDGRKFRNQYVSPEHVRSWYGITTPFFKLSAYIFIFNEILYYLLFLSFIYSVRVHISIKSYSNNNLHMPGTFLYMQVVNTIRLSRYVDTDTINKG